MTTKLLTIMMKLCLCKSFISVNKHGCISSSLHVFTNNNIEKYLPKTEKQQQYVSYLTNPQTHLVVATGPAGTGKTLFACKNAIENLKNKKIEKIVLTRPLISVANEDIGFLPGNINKKMSIWVQPMINIFEDFYTKKELQNLIETGVIEITPLMHMRGRTFKNTNIIVDEVQNTTPVQLLMVLTRCGEGAKMVLTGDLQQSDIKEKNGLCDFIEKYKKYQTNNNNNTIEYVEFENVDVQRSLLVKLVLEMYTTTTTASSSLIKKQPVPSLEYIPPPPHTTTSFLSLNAEKIKKNKEYIKRVNDAVSKMPNEYGDYMNPL